MARRRARDGRGTREAAALLEELELAAGEHDERALIELDQRIHRHVYALYAQPVPRATLSEYYVLTLRIWFLALERVERLDDAVREHRELLGAIRDRDPSERRRPCGATCTASSGRSETRL